MKFHNIAKICIICIFVYFSLFTSCTKQVFDDAKGFTNYVNPFIGTGGHGHTYPGATVPFGMLQVSPDNGISGWDWCSGYHISDSIMIGFSHLHLSGTGIGDLGDIRLMPINKKVELAQTFQSRSEIPFKSNYSHENETAEAGYYSVFLEDFNIKAELTSDLRTAYHKYTFAENDQQSLVIDLGNTFNWDTGIISNIEIKDKFTVTGFRHSKGWAKNQKVFFVAKFSKSIKDFDLVSDEVYSDKVSVTGVKTSAQLYFNDLSDHQLEVKVGLSSVSVANAFENIKDSSQNFDIIRKKASSDWNQSLSKIQVETSLDSLKTIFYTALYHAQLAPVTFSDQNGEFRMENDSICKADNYTVYSTLSLWDTFRAQQPLLTLLEPNKVSDIINSMLKYYEPKGVLPVWTLYGNETNTMTGFHSIPVIAEAYIKGIKGFDINNAYQAMKATMMQESLKDKSSNISITPNVFFHEDRGLDHYKKYGYIPCDFLEESVTITLEYAYDDWCIAQIAKALGKIEDYDYFMSRSKSYINLFDTNSGFMRGKFKDGKAWREPFDPKHSAHRIKADYTEGNAWQHSWFVPHDVDNLIKLHGGDELFSEKLEQLFNESSEINGENISNDISGLIGQYAHGNEPSHHIAYLFNHSDKPWLTQYWVSQILKTQYNTTPNGLSGNEDCGQMSAWYVLSSMGLYPMNPASGNYEIGSPLFEKTTITISDDKLFIIEAEYVSDKNIYIQSATLNGSDFNKTFISHEQILKGGTLKFVMGPEPNRNWGV
tara:strand:- start:142 stop:2448 length:2307 start_codon:yes stop_codon:yes gene_type:complete